jgi:hypothetical protein
MEISLRNFYFVAGKRKYNIDHGACTMPDLHITRTADNKVMTINDSHIGDLV